MAKAKPKSSFMGRWRIVSMSAWGEDYIDEEEEGFFEFDEKGQRRVPLRLRPRAHGWPTDHTGR
jgi:hypothetical protein